MGLMLADPSDKMATLQDLRAVPVPPSTPTYSPINHGEWAEMVMRTMETNLPIVRVGEAWGLAREGRRMFGVVRYAVSGDFGKPDEMMQFSLGMRGAHDKSLARALCLGAVVTVCSNLCFGGDIFQGRKRHSSGFSQNFDAVLKAAIEAAPQVYRATVADMRSMRSHAMTNDEVFAALGLMFGRGIITSGEMIRALKYWRRPPHADHEGRNLYSAYQGVNDALKRAAPERAMEAHQGLHGFALELAEVGGVWKLGGAAAAADATQEAAAAAE